MTDYRNLFADTQPPSKADTQTADIAKSLFQNMPAAAALPQATSDCHAPTLIATPAGVAHRYKQLVEENETLVHRILDLSQSVKQREFQLEQQFQAVKKQAEELQAVIQPKRSFFGKTIAIDKLRAHQLIDSLQQFLKQDLRPDVFLYRDIDQLVAQTEYLERLIQILKPDAQQVLSADDILLARIVTQAQILTMQAASTRQLKQQLIQQLADIEQWRQHSLSLLVIDIQQKL